MFPFAPLALSYKSQVGPNSTEFIKSPYELRFTSYEIESKASIAMRDILDRQANTIEYLLHTHGIRASIDGGKLSPRLAHFHVVLPPGVRANVLAPLVPEIADELGVTSCRMVYGEEGVYLEVPRPDPTPVRLLPIVQRVADVVPPITATLGLDCEGTPLLLRLNSPEVDPLLITGNRGAGKSTLLGNVALSLALHNSPGRLRLLLIDGAGEGRAFRGLESLPHLACPLALGPTDAMLSLRWAIRLLARHAHASDPFDLEDDEADFDGRERDDLATASLQPALIVLVDGADALLRSGNRRADAEAAAALNKLIAQGSRHNIHIVISAEQLPAIDNLEADWRARIVGQVSSPEAARMATGMKSSGAQSLIGTGDFLIAMTTELIRFQAPTVSSSEIARAVDLICSFAQEEAQPSEQEYAAETEYDAMPPIPALVTLASTAGAYPRQRRGERPLDEPIPLRTWVGE